MSNINSYSITAILSLQTLCSCLVTTIGQYIYAFYLQAYPYPFPTNGTTNGSRFDSIIRFDHITAFNANTSKCAQNDLSTDDDDAQAWAQQRSADLFFWTNLFSFAPLIVMTYVLGLYTPKLGKCFVLLLPWIGTTAQFAIWLSIIYFHLPEYCWYISAIISGLSGSNGVLTFVLNLIITENTMKSELSSRFVRLGAIQTALSAVATLSAGYYIDWRGFTDLYWIGLGLSLLAILIVLTCFRSTQSTNDERRPLLSPTTDSLRDHEFKSLTTTRCNHCFDVCKVLRFGRRSPKKSISLLLTLFANIFYNLASSTFAPFLWFLLNVPFCWTSKDIGNYSAVAAISYAILSVLGMKALTNIGASDTIICFLSHLCFGASCFWLAFARQDWELYAGVVLSAFSGYQGSLSTSMMSKWLEPHELIHAFTLVTEINTIVFTAGTSFFNWVYARTVVDFRSLTLFLGAGICVIPMILNLCLFFIRRRMSDEDSLLTSSSSPQLPPELEAAPLRMPSSGPPHAGDAACILIRSQSWSSFVHTSPRPRSRRDSLNTNDTDYTNTI